MRTLCCVRIVLREQLSYVWIVVRVFYSRLFIPSTAFCELTTHLALGLAAVQASPRELGLWGEAAANPRTASAQALFWAQVMLRQLHFRRAGAQDLRKPVHLETQATYGQNNTVALRRLFSLEPTWLVYI